MASAISAPGGASGSKIAESRRRPGHDRDFQRQRGVIVRCRTRCERPVKGRHAHDEFSRVKREYLAAGQQRHNLFWDWIDQKDR